MNNSLRQFAASKAISGLTIVLLILTMASPGGVRAQPASKPAQQVTWIQQWADEFNGSGAVSGANWIYDLGTGYGCAGCPSGWGTGEIEVMTNSTNNVFQSGGNLNIRALHTGTNPNTGWTSGRIETVRTDFQPPAGGRMAIEGRIQLPNVTGAAAAGYWPAFWTLGAPFRGNYLNWPSVGEIDILENVNGLNQWFGTLHCGTSPGGPCNENSGIGGSASGFSPSLTSAFHVYRMEFDKSVAPQQLRWYVDGVQRFSINSNQLDATVWNNATNHGFFIILNLAMGGGFPAAFGGGPTASTVSGGTMLIDYVRVFYSSGGTGPTPTRTRTPAANPTRTSTPTRTPTPAPGGGRDAYSTIQAESYNSQSGTQTESTTDTGGGQNVGWIANGDFLVYNNVNFGSPSPITVRSRVASGAGGGVSGLVEFHLDSVNGPMIGSFSIANTGGWQSWTTVPANVGGATGVHNLYVVFKSGQPADFVNINWFVFQR
jgi:beta-glucanase (GH16 family)